MGKTRDLFKTSRDTKTTFQSKMGTIKDRNGNTQNCTKNLNDPDNQDGVITHLARYPGLLIQVGLRKHHYEQS